MHAVEIDHGYWSAKRRILVDGHEVVRFSPGLKFMTYWASPTIHEFEVAGSPATISVTPNRQTNRYDISLFINGTEVELYGLRLPTSAWAVCHTLRR